MTLWKLYVNDDFDSRFTYDCALGFVVRAGDEAMAREIASHYCGDEGRSVWIDPGATSCEVIDQDGEYSMILRDFNAG